ncbi:MAG: hypothetical protein WBH55_15170, partial [Bacteroidota bacterium]
MQLRSILIGTLLFGITQATAQLQLPVLPEDHAGGCSKKSSLSKGLPVSPGAFADNRIDVIYYKLDLTMDIPASRVAGTVTVRATSLVDSLREFTLDLSGAMTVDSVTIEGQAVLFSRFPEGIGIPLNPARSPGNTFTAEVSYHGVPRVTG